MSITFYNIRENDPCLQNQCPVCLENVTVENGKAHVSSNFSLLSLLWKKPAMNHPIHRLCLDEWIATQGRGEHTPTCPTCVCEIAASREENFSIGSFLKNRAIDALKLMTRDACNRGINEIKLMTRDACIGALIGAGIAALGKVTVAPAIQITRLLTSAGELTGILAGVVATAQGVTEVILATRKIEAKAIGIGIANTRAAKVAVIGLAVAATGIMANKQLTKIGELPTTEATSIALGVIAIGAIGKMALGLADRIFHTRMGIELERMALNAIHR